MALIELIYDSTCPNAGEARKRLAEALERLNLPQEWTEWERGDPGSPDHARLYGSPTILVEGTDVAGQEPGGTSCRLYADREGGGFSGVPAVKTIMAALENAAGPVTNQGGQTNPGHGAVPLVGAVFSAGAASVCCVGPLALAALGVGGAWAGTVTGLSLYQPFFAVIAVGLLGFSFRRAYGKPGHGSCADGSCKSGYGVGKTGKAAVWLSAVLVSVLIASPHIIPQVFAGSAITEDAPAQSVVLEVDNMTCESCPIAVRKRLMNLYGVHDAIVTLNRPGPLWFMTRKRSPWRKSFPASPKLVFLRGRSMPGEGSPLWKRCYLEEIMGSRKIIEVFSAGCPLCDEAVKLARKAAFGSHEVVTLDMREAKEAERATALGVRSVPAIAIDGKLAACCAGRGVDPAAVKGLL